jgi:curved DNA-binding protein CbpA
MDSSDPETVADAIDDKYESIQDQNYYEVLGVSEEADRDEMTSVFRELAQEWHADSFSGVELDERRKQKVQEIFATINTAYQTLSTPSERKEYDAALETGEADIKAVFDAEDAFRKGRNMLNAGRYEGAHNQFSKAVDRSPDESQYVAHLLYTEYMQIPKDEKGNVQQEAEAREILADLKEILEEHDDKAWMYAFVGVVLQGLGKIDAAEHNFREALRIESDNRIAQQRLRLIDMRRKRSEERSWLQQLLAKFNLG